MMMDRRTFIAGTAATLVAPRPGWAQALPRVAIVHRGLTVGQMTETGAPNMAAFLLGLRERGFIEGETVSIERWSGEGRTQEGIAEMVASVVGSQPDVIMANGRILILAFVTATKTIPIAGTGTFPEGTNMARPGGNYTGVSSNAGGLLHAKRLQLLRDAVPTATQIAFLVPRTFWEDNLLGGSVRAAGAEMGVELVPFILELPITEQTIREAAASISGQGIEAVYISSSTLLNPHYALLAEVMVAQRLAAIAGDIEAARSGQLMSYSRNTEANFRQLADVVAEILNGADPGELPIHAPTAFDLAINMGTARALGLTLPPKVVLAATEVIE